MSRARLAFALWIVLALAPVHQLPARQTQGLVIVDVAVERADGNLETGLRQDAFEIVAGGSTCPVQFFAAGDRGLSLVLLIDVSVSMKSGAIAPDELKEAAEKSFVNRLAPSDRARIGSIARDPFLSPQFTSDRRQLRRTLETATDPDDANTYGPSPVWDAAYAAVTALSTAEGRRALVLMTDGRATGNRHSPEDLAAHAVRANVSINSVGIDSELIIPQGGGTAVRVRPGATQQWLATITGGQYVPVPEKKPVPGPVLERILADLRGSYTLGFEPPIRDGSLQKLDVRVKQPGLKVRARTVYVSK
jgi:VWFA-related protein